MGFGGGAYLWHGGYWGQHIGFYGGVNYGFGYGGVGFSGGDWNGGHFFYNTAVSHINVNVVHNTYIRNTTVINNNTHVSYNGGSGGLAARPNAGNRRPSTKTTSSPPLCRPATLTLPARTVANLPAQTTACHPLPPWPDPPRT